MAQQEPIRKRHGASGSGSNGAGSSGPREIPDKLYFRIGEVAKLCEIPAYVLRFWESEFPQLKPNKGGTGQRLYRRRDVEMALRIKTLLYDEGYTIAGARQAFKAELRTSKDPQLGLGGIADTVDTRHLAAIQKELRDLLGLLSKPATAKTGVQPIRAARPVPKPQPEFIAEPAPAPRQFPRPKLLHSARPVETAPDMFSDTLFHDLFSHD